MENLKSKNLTKYLYLHMQVTPFTCGTATYLTLNKNKKYDFLEHINEEISRMLFIKRISDALIVTALNFAELAEEDRILDKLEGLYFLDCSYSPHTLSNKILELVSKYEKLGSDQVYIFKKKFEERFKKYNSYVKILKRDQFEEKLVFFLKRPLIYNVAVLTYQNLDNNEKIPHWMVALSVANSYDNEFHSEIFLCYDPFRNAVLYLDKELFLKLIYEIEELHIPPQFVVFKNNNLY